MLINDQNLQVILTTWRKRKESQQGFQGRIRFLAFMFFNLQTELKL